MKIPLCPVCQNPGNCHYLGDTGGPPRANDVYEFACPVCGHKEAKEASDGKTDCPFCGEAITLHGQDRQTTSACFTVKFGEKGLVFDCGTLSRPYGEPDGDGSAKVLYTDIPKLKPEPEDRVCIGTRSRMDIFVPQANCRIVFFVYSHQETGIGPLDESLDGPYLVTAKKDSARQ